MAKNAKGHGRDAKILECLCGHAVIPHANGLCKKCYRRKWMNDWYERSMPTRKPDHWRARNLKTVFNMSVAEYDEMLHAQNGVCAICGRPPKAIRLAVDHNHQTGKIRALLCGPCNTALSHVEHESDFSKKALIYLEAH